MIDDDPKTPFLTRRRLASLTLRQVLLEMVLEQPGVDVNERDSDYTAPLITAAKLCYSEIMDVLLKHHADVNIVDKRGRGSHTEFEMCVLL